MKRHTTENDRELEHYVWQHKNESLRKIRSGMLQEKGRTKSTKWIRPRREEARQAEETPEVEVELPTEETIRDEEEQTDETRRDEETTIEDDPEIIKINKQRRRLEAEIKRVKTRNLLEEDKKKLALAEVGFEETEDLVARYNILRAVLDKERKFIDLLKESLEKIMEETGNYYPDLACADCKGCFLWKEDDETLVCAVCNAEYKMPKD